MPTPPHTVSVVSQPYMGLFTQFLVYFHSILQGASGGTLTSRRIYSEVPLASKTCFTLVESKGGPHALDLGPTSCQPIPTRGITYAHTRYHGASVYRVIHALSGFWGRYPVLACVFPRVVQVWNALKWMAREWTLLDGDHDSRYGMARVCSTRVPIFIFRGSRV